MQMPRAKVRSFHLRTKMGHLGIRWVLRTISILHLILLMFLSALIFHIQKLPFKLGLALWWSLLQWGLHGERNIQLLIQNHQKEIPKDKNTAWIKDKDGR